MRPPLKPSLASGDRQPRRPAARTGARPRAAKTVAIDDWHLAAPRKRPRSTRIEAKDCGCQGGIHRYRRQSDGNYAHATGSTVRESPAILTSRPPRHTGFVYRRWPALAAPTVSLRRRPSTGQRDPSITDTRPRRAGQPAGRAARRNFRSRRLTPAALFRIVIT